MRTSPRSCRSGPVISQPAVAVDAPIDVEVEARAARPHAGDPHRAFAAAHDEVVAPLAGRVRQVAEQVAAAEVAGDRHRLAGELPRLERQRAQRGRDHRLRGRHAADLQQQFLARARPASCDSRPSAKLPARGSPDSRRPTSMSCPRTSTAPARRRHVLRRAAHGFRCRRRARRCAGRSRRTRRGRARSAGGSSRETAAARRRS